MFGSSVEQEKSATALRFHTSTSTSTGARSYDRVVDHEGPGALSQGGVPKRPKLLLDRPSPGGAGGSESSSAQANVRRVHGDVPPEELAGYEEWPEDLLDTMAQESEESEAWEPSWDANGEQAPDLGSDELEIIDMKADFSEVTRLLEMSPATGA